MFIIAFAFLLPTLLTIAYASLRSPAWPGGLNALVAMGLLAMVVLGISMAFDARGPVFALGFTLLAAMVGLAMLAGLYERDPEISSRVFAILLAGALVCATLSTSADLIRHVAPWRAPFPEPAVAAAARWLLAGAGLAAFPAFSPDGPAPSGAGRMAAGLGLSAASAFVLIFGAVAQPSFLSRIAGALRFGSSGSLSGILYISAAAAAVFLTLLTAFRCFSVAESRARAYGLLFVLLAGWPHRIAYQHLLALAGVALLTASRAPQPPVDLRMIAIPDPPPRDA
jgi:hypothetical protein